jgi:hypothetical protein
MILEREKKQKQFDDQHFRSKQPSKQTTPEGIDGEVGLSQTEEAPKGIEASTLPREEQQTETSLVRPKPEDFNLPANAEDWNLLVAKLVELGLSSKEVNASLEKKEETFQ